MDVVTAQVRCLGLVENVIVRRAGFCYRETYATFLERYKILSASCWPHYPKSATEVTYTYTLATMMMMMMIFVTYQCPIMRCIYTYRYILCIRRMTIVTCV